MKKIFFILFFLIFNTAFSETLNYKDLEKLSKKLIRFEKQKHTQSLNQISKLKRMLFPNNNLQERYDNFIPYYLKYGDNFIKILKNELNPLDSRFVILTLKQ